MSAPSAARAPAFDTDPRWADDLTRARTAVVEVTPPLLELLRSAQRPDAMAVGEWTIADVAAHLTYIAAGELMLARSVGQPLPEGPQPDGDIIATATGFNALSLKEDSERDLLVLADRLERGVDDFLETMKDLRGDEPVGWLAGTVIPSSALACHLLEEWLVHGFDIARAEGKPWRIPPEHAALGFGFVIDIISLSHPNVRRRFVDQDAARGVRACIDFRMRGERRDFFVFDDGLVTIEDPSPRPVDCHISADPVAALLVGMGRIGPIKPALTGRMMAWGRKPWLAFRLNSMLKNP